MTPVLSTVVHGMQWLIVTLLCVVGLSYALDCYVCNKTVKTVTMDRFTKETKVKERLVCNQDIGDWSIETCSDEKQFCMKKKRKTDWSEPLYRRGCVVPNSKFFITFEDDFSIFSRASFFF